MAFVRYSLAIVLAAVLINLIPGWLNEKVQVPPVTGFVESGWEHVRDVYRQLYADDYDRGSSLGVYHEGKLVVDLRGGFADEQELWPWQENTLTRIFSTSKGIAAVCVAMLVDRGLIDYGAPVTKYWPEFGANDKENVTVEMLLSHQAGVATITSESYDIWDEINDVDKLSQLLAEQKPLWKPGSAVGYHPMNIGLYMDQLVRHVDPKQRSIPQFFREEIQKPFDIDISFGLPDKDMYRMASLNTLRWKFEYLFLPYVRGMLYNFLIAPDDPDVPGLFKKTITKFGTLAMRRRPDVNKLWNPSGFAYANGRSLAKLFGILANGGSHNGKTLLSKKAIEWQTKVIKTGLDKVLKTEVSYGRGYRIFMSPKETLMFGSPGSGGQIGYADPTNKIAIGFTTNYLAFMGAKDFRYRTLEKAIYECVERIEIKTM